jgi:hypothetical protein
METPEFSMNVDSIKVMRQHQIMRVLVKYPRITVGEVSRKTGLSKTYCFNLLQGMIYRGLVATIQGRARAGQDTRLYQTAFDHTAQGLDVPELSGDEKIAMALHRQDGLNACDWYGYPKEGQITVTQELLF